MRLVDKIRALSFSALFLLIVSPLLSLAQPAPAPLAATPPMGWNSWDAYGFTIDEAQFRDNVKVLAGMKEFGWQYAMIDEGWYMQNPFAATTAEQKYLYDQNGLLLPVEARFPSSADNAGFKPLADWVHAQGLKFGIHILRGIPKEVVDRNLPIAGSSLHAADAADKESTCPWNDANYGVADNAAGQAYYDSMLKRYAEWGIDFIKVDCISDHPYRPTEIRQIAEAIRKTNRPIVLSLSPGPTNLSHAAEVAKYAQMWRITDDHWDVWKDADKKTEFPFGLAEEFDRIASWNKHNHPGSWPDPDMLPEGSLQPHPGWGQPRTSRYTADEQRFEFTLWVISRSPLIWGGNLTHLDDLSRRLMTNRELTRINQTAVETKPLSNLPATLGNVKAWYASAEEGAKKPEFYLAFFNMDDKPAPVNFKWNELSFRFAGKHATTDLWDGRTTGSSEEMHFTLPAHGSAIYRIQ